MTRNNEDWLAQLSSVDSVQTLAISDLGSALLRGLRGAISKRSHVDESFLEDVVQDSLMLILAKLNQFEGRSQFLTWATSIAIRVAMSKLRRKQWEDVSLEEMIENGDLELGIINDDNSRPEILWEKDSMLDKMHTVIQDDLTEKQRIALLAELKGIPQDEIARHLGSNRNAIYKLTHDARKRLKQGLEAAGYKAGDVNMAFTT